MPDLRLTLDRLSTESNREPIIMEFHMRHMLGNDTEPLLYFEPLPKQRHLARKFVESPYSRRFLHYKTSETYKYSPGRHVYDGGSGARIMKLDGFILKWQFTPWPESKKRKMNVGTTIPESDKAKGFGLHHLNRVNEAAMDNEYATVMGEEMDDLCDESYEEVLLMFHRTFHDVFGKCRPGPNM